MNLNKEAAIIDIQLNKIIGEKYEIVRQLDNYGENVLYFGRDITDDKQVCIREFFSEAIMLRDASGNILVKADCEVKFKSLSMDFEELCDYLMKLPENFPVIRPIEVIHQNNTVYCIEEYVETQTLEDFLARKSGKVTWQRLKRMISPLIKLLGKMHSDGIYHRGISLETVMVTRDQNLLLSGFSIPAARTAESEINSTLYFGYSSPEQYSSNSWQGSWSDVYSLAAVCYRALTGVTPVEWRQRGEGINFPEPVDLVSDIPQNVSNAIMKALNVELSVRYHTIEELWCDFLVSTDGGTITYPIIKRQDTVETVEPYKKINTDLLKQPLIIALIAMTFVSVFAISFAYKIADTYIVPAAQQSEASLPQDSKPVDIVKPVEEPEEEIIIPQLIGDNVEKILLDPTYQELFDFRIERVFSETMTAGDVVAQSPQAGERFNAEKTSIFLWISKGSELITMPNVVGYSLDKAIATLEMSEIGYSVTFVPAESEDGKLENGTILETSIPAGEVVHRNSDIVEIMAAEVIERQYAPFENNIDEYTYHVPPRVVIYWPPLPEDAEE